MSFDLHNHATKVSRKYSKQFLAKALELAQLYGWKPMGTYTPCPDIDWLGTYLTNDGQVVKTIDAFLLADALQKSLEHISDVEPNIDWNPQFWKQDDLPEWLSPEEKAIIEEGLQDGLMDIVVIRPQDFFAGAEKRTLIEFIQFCRLGSFVIL